eukprot:4724815-Lingulodinium_polyedra.AAC.1
MDLNARPHLLGRVGHRRYGVEEDGLGPREPEPTAERSRQGELLAWRSSRYQEHCPGGGGWPPGPL